jgi:hypothetical protein
MPDMPTEDNDVSAPGWDAIDVALDQLYPDQEPRHWGTVIRYMLGGQDPLDGISAYMHNDGNGQAHWHYVSYGMTELYDKTSEDNEFSGWGFEFTFRLKTEPGQSDPPPWPFGLLQNLARYVFKTGNVFSPGHYFHLNGPIALDEETLLHAALMAEDPELGLIDTPHGKVQFIQIVGATLDEQAAGVAWNTEGLLRVMRNGNPLLVTDLARRSILEDPVAAQAISEGTAREGSSTGSFTVRELSVQEPEPGAETGLAIVLGANGVPNFQVLLRGRIGFDRFFHVFGPQVGVTFMPADAFGWRIIEAEREAQVSLPAPGAVALAAVLKPIRGDYQVPQLPGLTLRIVPSEIKDATGKNVVKVIG